MTSSKAAIIVKFIMENPIETAKFASDELSEEELFTLRGRITDLSLLSQAICIARKHCIQYTEMTEYERDTLFHLLIDR